MKGGRKPSRTDVSHLFDGYGEVISWEPEGYGIYQHVLLVVREKANSTHEEAAVWIMYGDGRVVETNQAVPIKPQLRR